MHAPSSPSFRLLPCLVRLSWVLLLAAACGRSSRAPLLQPVELNAEPEAFAPGATVELLPLFAGGPGRIEPGVGSVESGRRYVVGPVRVGQRYTLIVALAGGGETTVARVVPLRYRERITPIPPSPIARTRHGAAMLADGRVLMVGGGSPGPLFWATAETFRGGSNAFAPVGDLSTGRDLPAIVALADDSAFAFGGASNTPSFDVATRVEQWDPGASAWSVRGNLRCNRSLHTATLLPDGSVLVAGGFATGGLPGDRDAELWVPGTGAVSPAGEMLTARFSHTATRLADGRVLLVGGFDTATGAALASTEWFDPATGVFTAGPSLADARGAHAAVEISDGSLLVIGGERNGELLASAERLDLVTGAFAPAGQLAVPRTDVRAVRRGDGAVLVAGGSLGTGVATASVELWQPARQGFATLPFVLPEPRTGHTLHLLPDGRVVLLGGDAGSGFPAATAIVFE